jgi:hypothetical protein
MTENPEGSKMNTKPDASDKDVSLLLLYFEAGNYLTVGDGRK